MKSMIEDLPLPPATSSELPAPGAPVQTSGANSARLLWIMAAVVFLAAILVRVCPSAGFTGVGFDEALYRDYVIKLDKVGLLNYPEICQVFLEDQRKPEVITKLPPTRFLYIFTSWLWKRVAFGDAPPIPPRTLGFPAHDPAMVSLHAVAALFSVLLVAAAGACAWRMFGLARAVGVLALVAFTPTQIHMAQHALIDGFFAFWATLCVWMLWEALRHPRDARWLAGYGVSLALMVLTKENAFFVFVALAGLIGVNRWARFGQVTPRLLLVTVGAPLLGLLILVALAGGVASFIEIYRLLVSKAETLTYAIKTGDGPWHRYLVDMLIVSPLILVLAIGGAFTQLGKSRACLFLAVFVAGTYVFMCNVKYAMNLRYATIWDLPLCALATAQIDELTRGFGRRQPVVAAMLVAGLCAFGLRQYLIFFADFPLYELVTEGLLRAVKILK